MDNAGKSNLQMVQANWEEIERKVREHHKKQLKILAIIVGICVALGITYYIYVQHKSYDDFRIVSTVDRSDTNATKFTEFNGNLLKYSNDGASCVTVDNQIVWNQSFEMQDPILAVCKQYVAFADKDGKQIYVMNSSGTQGKFSVTMPIQRIDVSASGTVAVMMEEDGTGYLALYSKSGEQLAEGAIHVENGGTPMDLALSQDGEKLAVSSLDIHEGSAKSTVTFYNFGSVGEEKVDHIVASFSYDDAVIPELAYVGSDQVIAFSDQGVYTFTGGNTPKEGPKKQVEDEIKAVFYDDSYFALVFAAGKDEAKRKVVVYNMKCDEQTQFVTDFPFEKMRFLDNHEICLYSSNLCSIYTLGGRKKFYYEFEDAFCEVLHVGGYRRYAFVMEGKTQQIRLRLFGSGKAGEK